MLGKSAKHLLTDVFLTPNKGCPMCGVDEGLNKISGHLKFSVYRCYSQFYGIMIIDNPCVKVSLTDCIVFV